MCLAVSLCACGPEELVTSAPEKQTAAITPLRILFVGMTVTDSGRTTNSFWSKLGTLGPITHPVPDTALPTALQLKQNYDLVVIGRMYMAHSNASASLVGFVAGGGRVLLVGGFDNTSLSRTREQEMMQYFGIAVNNTGVGITGATSFGPSALTQGALTTPPAVYLSDYFSDAVGTGVTIEAFTSAPSGAELPMAVSYQSLATGGGRAVFWLDELAITDDPATGVWSTTQAQYWDNVFNYLNP